MCFPFKLLLHNISLKIRLSTVYLYINGTCVEYFFYQCDIFVSVLLRILFVKYHLFTAYCDYDKFLVSRGFPPSYVNDSVRSLLEILNLVKIFDIQHNYTAKYMYHISSAAYWKQIYMVHIYKLLDVGTKRAHGRDFAIMSHRLVIML